MSQGTLNEQITRSLAYMLRHQPDEFDLELDSHGFGDLGDVVCALNERLGEPIEEDDVRAAIDSGDRQRYEIVGDRIRALYGHSIRIEPGEPAEPPELLYVGVGSRDADRAENYGLKSGRRTFLHLALTYEDAQETGRRIAPEYVVITVHAAEAFDGGVDFYDRKSLFLAREIPTEFLEMGEIHTDGIRRPPRGDRFEERGGGRHGRREDRDRHRGGRGGRRGFQEERAPAEHRGRDQAHTQDAPPSRFSRPEPERAEPERPRRREPEPPRKETVARQAAPPRDEKPAARTAAPPKPAKEESTGGFGIGIFTPPPKARPERKPEPETKPSPAAAKPAPAPEPTPEPRKGTGGFGTGVF